MQGPEGAAAPTTERLPTTAGDLELHVHALDIGDRTWTVLHTDAMLTPDDEQRFFRDKRDRLPYGVALWPAAIALAHDLAGRATELSGARVLELGAGVGLPGMVAAGLGARVTQSDRHALAMHICRWNGERNGVAASIEYRTADWTAWELPGPWDWIVGSDVLYDAAMHPALRRIFEQRLAPGGRVLLSDPFRAPGLPLLEALERDGWTVSLAKWTVGEADAPRAIGVYELARP